MPTSPDRKIPSGVSGWDDYAAFYDWENARTLGRRDVAFWQDVVTRERARVLELGCGTGRMLLPIARARGGAVGLDRSALMLAHARRRAARAPRRSRPAIVRGDVRHLPFLDASFGVVLAPYGLLQSLLSDRDLDAALAEAARVLPRGGLFGADLVPDVPKWAEYGPRVRMRGRTRGGATITLTEAVRQDRRKRLTFFDEQFTRRRGRREEQRRFTLTFRTLTMAQTVRRIERAGFAVQSQHGDYRGGPWQEQADVWVVLARKR